MRSTAGASYCPQRFGWSLVGWTPFCPSTSSSPCSRSDRHCLECQDRSRHLLDLPVVRPPGPPPALVGLWPGRSATAICAPFPLPARSFLPGPPHANRLVLSSSPCPSAYLLRPCRRQSRFRISA